MNVRLRLAAIAASSLLGLAAGCSGGPAVAAKDEPASTPAATTSAVAPTATSSAAAPPATGSETAPSTTPEPSSGAAAEPATPGAGSVQGTAWAGTDSDGDDYVYRFEANGQFDFTSPAGTRDGNPGDTWSQAGTQVTIRTSGGYSTRTGTLEGDTLSGSASNAAGHSWTWSAKRQ